MDILETIKLSIEGIRTNKMRSFLTMLGIIIGISSVIGITTIGSAMTKSVNKAFDTIGNSSAYIMVEAKNPEDQDGQGLVYPDDFMTKDMLEDVQKSQGDLVDEVVYQGPEGPGVVRQDKKQINVNIQSTSPGAAKTDKVKLLAGRFLNNQDIKKSKNVAVISDKVLDKIYKGDVNKALGSEVKVYKDGELVVLTVVGIYHYEKVNVALLGDVKGETSTLYMPYTTAFKEIPSDYDDEDVFQYVLISLKNPGQAEEDSQTLADYINKKYFADNSRAQVQVSSVVSEMKQVGSTMAGIQTAVAAIAGIALIVGGIGVMNILLVSVTERTREIGIRKALGATKNDIRKQFIIESVILCIIGGIFGILLGTLLGLVGSGLIGTRSLPSIFSILVAVGFSMAIGVFFGYYPANKAAKLDPIEALRYE
ncbi:Macrolide export ATP-binding/permease protein MacB [Urinicoccus massiliensis]|uniref:Macrolide export ATP-binding/permease protein MacB n=1 Tax=Urinicoccus massiliensis TaxID=1723382 RepID=A0A8H2M6L3_9FIRM|nr:ABC transporter permease [Urinicoccus massiliensis]VFB17026.1 Macrolide export ATP-binding/permease protein MacB [Urinicoccus massiliensis]